MVHEVLYVGHAFWGAGDCEVDAEAILLGQLQKPCGLLDFGGKVNRARGGAPYPNRARHVHAWVCPGPEKGDWEWGEADSLKRLLHFPCLLPIQFPKEAQREMPVVGGEKFHAKRAVKGLCR
jgi:hypothetical protein